MTRARRGPLTSRTEIREAVLGRQSLPSATRLLRDAEDERAAKIRLHRQYGELRRTLIATCAERDSLQKELDEARSEIAELSALVVHQAKTIAEKEIR